MTRPEAGGPGPEADSGEAGAPASASSMSGSSRSHPASSRVSGGGAPAPRERAADPLAERTVETAVIHRGRYLEFRIETIERADGSRGRREIVGHPGAVAVVALDADDRILLVRQWRTAAGQALREIPAGTLDVDPASGRVEDPLDAARRELEEETGYRAGRWERLTSFWSAPGFATELMHVYLATDLEPAHEGRLGPEEDERLELERVSWPDAVELVDRGEIADAKSLVGLLWLSRIRSKEAGGRSATDDGR